VRSAVSLLLVGALLGYVLPRLVGTTASEVGTELGTVAAHQFVGLAMLWAAGIFVHSFVLTGSLPGLTRTRALTLNLTGSAVSNVLPFGGAAGMSLNYLMIRSWGFRPSAFAAYTFVTNLWVVLLKLALPVLVPVVLLASATNPTPTLMVTAGVAGAALAVLIAVVIASLTSRAAAVRMASRVAPVAARIGRRLRLHWEPDRLAADLLGWRDRVAEVAGRGWGQLSVAMGGYAVLQATLLWGCLHAVGVHPRLSHVFAGYAADRVLTLIVLTPGGAGFAEAGISATLVALGGPPGRVTAGVLLYRGFTFALEIPVGGVTLAAWLLRRRLAARRA